jgi:hypothetical protein
MYNDLILHSPLISVDFDHEIVIMRPSVASLLKTETTELQALFDLAIVRYTSFVFDLSHCDYICSEALGFIAHCWKWCSDKRHGKMAVILPQDEQNEVAKLFEIIGLSRILGSAINPTLPQSLRFIREFAM